MKRIFTLLVLSILCCGTLFSQKQLILNTTGYGFNPDEANGINAEQWTYIQKFTNLSYGGQDASVTAVRLHIQWEKYEPTVGNYGSSGAKLVAAIQAITALKPGMKVALFFPYMRGGRINDSYFGDEDIARIYDGSKVQEDVAWTAPSLYSSTARTRFINFVNNALSAVSAYYGSILYVAMGSTSSEELTIPIVVRSGSVYEGFYEDKALTSWRTEYLPCRYPGQTNVTWNGTSYAIATAPQASYGSWNNDIGKEYYRFGAWGLVRLFKQFRDAVKSHSSSLKDLYFPPQFGTSSLIHNGTLPMGLAESDGIYTSEGTTQYDIQRKILSLDVIKGTNSGKIAAVEFDPEDLGEVQPDHSAGINASIANEWMPRAYKHGADYIHLAMNYSDLEIAQLTPTFANLRANYVNGSYTSPSRQPAVNANVYPDVFVGGNVFDNAWNTQSANSWSTTDLSPKSVNMIDDGFWQNIWSCSVTPDPCDFTPSASVSNSTPAASASISLSYGCSGSSCSGVTYAWSGNGISGSTSPLSVTAPSTAGTYTYTVTATKSGCTTKTATVSITVSSGGGGSNPCGFTEKGVIGTWSGLSVQTRQHTVSGSVVWLICTVPSGTSNDKYFPRGANFATRTDVTWTSGAPAKSCFGGGDTGWDGLVIPTGITVPPGYSQGTESDGAVYFAQSCSAPAAPSLSASPSTIASGSSSTLSASGCSGGTITWSNGLGTGTSKSVSPTATTTYTATCSIGGFTSGNGSVTVTVTPPSGGAFSQCLESESSSGNGSITTDPNASNGSTRGLESSYNHYVDYAITGVPSAGTYTVTLRYYSSSAPTVGVQVNGGTSQSVSLANSGSWNIVWTTQSFNVTLASGSNTIRIQGTGGGSCRQDSMWKEAKKPF